MPTAYSLYCLRMCETRQNTWYTAYETEKRDAFECFGKITDLQYSGTKFHLGDNGVNERDRNFDILIKSD